MAMQNPSQSKPYEPLGDAQISPAPPPTLQEILSSFSVCGNKDRDMLIRLLVEKSEQDQLITQTQKTQYERLAQYSLLREDLSKSRTVCQPTNRSVLLPNVHPTDDPACLAFNFDTTAQTDVPFIPSTGASIPVSPNSFEGFPLDSHPSASPCSPLRDAAPQLFPVSSVNARSLHVSHRLDRDSPVDGLTSSVSAQNTSSLDKDDDDDESRREGRHKYQLPPISSLFP